MRLGGPEAGLRLPRPRLFSGGLEPLVPVKEQGTAWPHQEGPLHVLALMSGRPGTCWGRRQARAEAGSGALSPAELSGRGPGGPEVGVQTPLCWVAGCFNCRASEMGVRHLPGPMWDGS